MLPPSGPATTIRAAPVLRKSYLEGAVTLRFCDQQAALLGGMACADHASGRQSRQAVLWL